MGAPSGDRSRVRDVVLAAGIVGVLAAVASRQGALFDPDSAVYLKAARLLGDDPGRIFDLPKGAAIDLNGDFPPLYSFLVGLLSRVSDEATTARWFGVLLAAATAAMLMGLLRRHCGPAVAWSALALVVAVRCYVLVLFGFIMSDGLFVALAVAVVAVLAPLAEARPPRRYAATLVAAAALATAATFTRLAGVSVVLALVVAILWILPAPSRRHRWVAASATALVGIVPIVVWSRTQGAAGQVGTRGLRWNPPVSGDWVAAEGIPASFLPRQATEAMGVLLGRAIGLAVIAAVLVWTVGRLRVALRGDAGARDRVVGLLLVTAWAHVAMLIASRLVFDPFISIAGRHTMLWSTCVFVAAALDVDQRLRAPSPPPWLRPAAIGVTAVLLLGASVPFGRMLNDPGAAWYNIGRLPPMELTDRALDADTDRPLFTNREDLPFLLGGRTARLFPPQAATNSGESEAEFADRLRGIIEDVCAEDGTVVLYERDGGVTPTAARVIEASRLEPEYEDEDGSVLRCTG